MNLVCNVFICFGYIWWRSVFLTEGGPKLRKWYGAPDLLPKDGTGVEEDESPGMELCSNVFVLVTAFSYYDVQVKYPSQSRRRGGQRCRSSDGWGQWDWSGGWSVIRLSSSISKTSHNCLWSSILVLLLKEMSLSLWGLIFQMIILSLIVKRLRVKTLVKDRRAAMEAFGAYVEVCCTRIWKWFLIYLPAPCSCNFDTICHSFWSRYLEMQGTDQFWRRLSEASVQLSAQTYARVIPNSSTSR